MKKIISKIRFEGYIHINHEMVNAMEYLTQKFTIKT